ncbi:Transcription elongation factor GreA [Pararobbsia alpina]
MPRTIAAVVSSGLAKKYELQTIYGSEDLHDFLEIILVDRHNEQVMSQPRN